MIFNVSEINPDYDFDITGASYAGNPIPGTVMYITKKVEKLLNNLQGVSDCLVFIETGMEPEKALKEKNCFVISDNPQISYARFMERFEEERFKEESRRKYRRPEGYSIGENVQIGKNAYIEPGCLIGHDVKIGDNCRIKAGAVIKNSMIGDNFICGENATVGTFGFTMAEDERGYKFRIPTLGKVIIGNNVEVGSLTNISCGSAGNTVIEDNVKLDSLVHIGHDAQIGMNSEITAGCIIGGFDELGPSVYMGINSATRNRIKLESHCLIGMGAVVTKDVPEGMVVVGNPARKLVK